MTKHEEYFLDMLENNKEMFDEFKKIHDNYVQDPASWKKEFNQKGQDIVRIIRKYENMLCGKSESGKYGKFSSKLAEKFWESVRNLFPKIDFVGIL